jgi:hypothetical protein
MARNFHLRERSSVRLVSLCDRNSPLYIILPPQRGIVVEDSAIPSALGIAFLHYLAHLRSTLLDR